MTPASKGLTREEALRMAGVALSSLSGRDIRIVDYFRVRGTVADLLLSIDRSARESEWEARGGPELAAALRDEHDRAGRCWRPETCTSALALTRTESPATAPASEEGR